MPAAIQTLPLTEKEKRQRTRIECGIRQDYYGYEAQVKGGNNHIVSKRFRVDTPLAVIRDWRFQKKSDLQLEKRLKPTHVRPTRLARTETGWCYIYFVRAGGLIKIGRAVDPYKRVQSLQTAHGETLSLVAAIPGHAIIEAAIHQRFARQRRNGEWFEITEELIDLIERLKAGENPVPLVW